MKCFKHICHLGVDSLFKFAFGDDLEILHMPNISAWVPEEGWLYSYCNPKKLPVNKDLNWLASVVIHFGKLFKGYNLDLFIFDDYVNVVFKSFFNNIKECLFYCHGHYTNEFSQKSIQLIFKNWLEKQPLIIFPTEDKKKSFSTWYDLDEDRCIIVSMAVHDHILQVPISDIKNDKILFVVNDLINRVSLYPECENLVKDIIFRLCEKYKDDFDIVGINTDDAWRDNYRKFVHDIICLKDYSIGVYPLGHKSPSMSLLETMSLGIPCVTMPREGFSEDEHEKSYFLASSFEEFEKYIELLKNDKVLADNVGLNGREFIKKNFSSYVWKEKVLDFVGKFIKETNVIE